MPEVLVGGHVIARQLKAEGVTCVFTLCGGHIAPIYDGCLREGIDIIDTRHEQAAVHAADGWSRLTRGCGVAILTAGPGVTDGVTGVANAFQASIPLLVLGGASELRFKGKGALQEMEQTSLLAPITKASFTATDPKRLAEYIRTGIRIATSGVPGPVFIELPFDVLTAQVTDPPMPAPPRPWPAQPGDPIGIAAAAALIAAADKPMIFAGSQVYWDAAWDELRALAERAQIPVFTNAMGRGCLDSRHPLAFSQARKNAFRGTDLAIILGTPLDFRVGYGAGINAKAKVIQLERDPTKVAQNRDAEVALLGDARSVLGQLAAAAPAATGRTQPWIDELRAAETKAHDKLLAFAASDARPINHYRLAHAIAQVIDDDTIVIGDGGDCVALGAKLLHRNKPGTWMDPGPLGCLGIGAPFALAAKKLHPDKKVLVLSGDGSFGLNGFDFETAIRWNLPMCVVVANDAAWGQIRGPQVMIFGAARSPATKLAPTRYDKVVEAFGGKGYHVEDPADLVATLRAALAEPTVTCVNVSIDPEFVVKSGAAKLTV
ncbi:MAG: acetolactate synthase [Kofleriaceae bacterium]|jgi:acetolactate synthase-1/2/3 large subunit|nr:acetolactate synthase [Kofleriaceae bacterium]MBP9172894.1 acetolactate synthase [Kofleriaceae bacterium]MBP9863414.1 acetolactate synthase [Kofleriaceae bacterium]